MLRKDKKRKQRGWVVPGYRYLGPGNDLHSGKPTTEGDKAAQKHDWLYDEFFKIYKVDPKFVYNEADDQFINEVGTKHKAEWFAKNLFKVKRKFADLGIIRDFRPKQKAKREFTTFEPLDEFKKRKRDTTFDRNVKSRVEHINSFFNLPTEDTMSGNEGSGHAAGLHETPVDEVPRQVFRGPPDSVFASLPYYFEYNMSRNMYVHDFAWRPTSVYDCMVDFNSSVDINAGTGVSTHYQVLPSNSTDATAQKARWFDYYASLYKYYHVVACRYEIYVENNCTDDVWVHLMPINDVEPPINATNTDMLQWSDTESVCLRSRGISIITSGRIEQNDKSQNVVMEENGGAATQTENFETGNMLENMIGKKAHLFKGVYRTGDYSRQIRLDENVENWTAVTTNPSLVERLLLRIKTHWESYASSDTQTRDRPISLTIRTKMEYLVEFKELKDGLKYPTHDQPYVATINSNN